ERLVVVADDHSVERRIGDAHDRQLEVVDLDRLADDVWVGAEIAAPETVVEDGVGMSAWRDFVRRQNRPPEFRPNAEDLEVVAADQLRVNRFRVLSASEI